MTDPCNSFWRTVEKPRTVQECSPPRGSPSQWLMTEVSKAPCCIWRQTQRCNIHSRASLQDCCCCSVTQSYLTLHNPMDCSPPGSSVHGDSPGQNTGVGCHFLLQGIFLIHVSWIGRQILLLLSFFLYFNWRLITLQYCGGFCHTPTWISHGDMCVPHSKQLSHLPPHPIPLGCGRQILYHWTTREAPTLS